MSDLEALQKELAELEAEKAAREAARAQREAEDEARARIEAAKRELADEEVLDRFRDELGERGKRWTSVSTSAGVVIVKRPHPATFKKFRDAGKYKTKELEEFVRPCVAHPDAQGLTDLLNDFPAVLDKIADAAFELAEGRVKEISGK